MKKACLEISYDTLDKLVKDQLQEWLEHYRQEVYGEATWFVHPKDREEAILMYAALKKVLEMYEV